MNTHPSLLRIQRLLRLVDESQPAHSARRNIERILVRQATTELDHALPWQRGHGRRTAVLSHAIGSLIGLSCDVLHDLMLASLLHDIGLLALPTHLAGHLEYTDSQSYAAIQCHPKIGAQWLAQFRFLRNAGVIIAHHHERWDGSGYPYGIRGFFIPIGARILAVADAFDTIVVPKVQEQSQRDQIALRILMVAAGTQFDSAVVEHFAMILRSQQQRGGQRPMDWPAVESCTDTGVK